MQWKDGSTSWEKLADLKESYSIERTEYVVSHDIADKPAFNWLVAPVLK